MYPSALLGAICRKISGAKKWAQGAFFKIGNAILGPTRVQLILAALLLYPFGSKEDPDRHVLSVGSHANKRPTGIVGAYSGDPVAAQWRPSGGPSGGPSGDPLKPIFLATLRKMEIYVYKYSFYTPFHSFAENIGFKGSPLGPPLGRHWGRHWAATG